MILDKLYLNTFKNYNACNIAFNTRVNFIYGDNGNGKTNILESISMLCYTKSFLQSSEPDCVKHDNNDFCINGEFVNNSGSRSKISFRYDKQNSSKELFYNNEQIKRFSSFFGKIPLVILSPLDSRLTAGSPNDKRKNFDILISQSSGLYFDALKNYNRIILQKNSLLKENLLYSKYTPSQLSSLIEPWNESLVNFGVKLILKRLQFVAEFQEYIENNFREIAGEFNIPVVVYNSSIIENEEDVRRNAFSAANQRFALQEEELKRKLRIALEQNYNLELRRGMSLVGPHRDKYLFLIGKNGNLFELKYFGSQGEQKTFLAALKLAEYLYLRDKHEDSNAGDPILLLDDLFSELDKSRIKNLTAILPRFSQVFLTTTNYEYMDILKNAFNKEDISAFNIVNGTAALTN